MNDRVWDQGLQPERTALAWRRTSLALTVGSLIGLRVLPPLLGPASAVLAGLGIVASLTVLAAAHRRYRRVHRLLVSGREAGDAAEEEAGGSSSSSTSSARTPTTGGGLPAATAALALAAGVGTLVVALGTR